MQGIFLNTLISCFAVTTIWHVMSPGEIFERLGKFFERNLPEKIHDPVFACPICMFPWYGIPFYVFVINYARKFSNERAIDVLFELLIVLFLGIGIQVLMTAAIGYFRESK